MGRKFKFCLLSAFSWVMPELSPDSLSSFPSIICAAGTYSSVTNRDTEINNASLWLTQTDTELDMPKQFSLLPASKLPASSFVAESSSTLFNALSGAYGICFPYTKLTS